MAFNGHQSTLENSLFPTFQRQASVNIETGNNGSVALPFVSIPGASLQEQNTASYLPWSHIAHDDPYGLINCSQNNFKIRKPTDSTDCEGETDLQGLVSNILDERDSHDSYYSKGNLPTCNPVWSSKTLKEELLQYFQTEPNQPTFPPNYASRETSSKAQGHSVDKDVQFHQQSNGLSTNQQWPLPNGDKESYTHRAHTLPPGLPMPKQGNTFSSQVLRHKYDNVPERRHSQSVNNLPDLSSVFRPQSEMNSPCFHPYYEDQYVQSLRHEQSGQRDINQLVSSFQSFMVGEHDGLWGGDSPNIQRQHEDGLVEQWKIPNPSMSTQSSAARRAPKQLAGELGTAQMERNGGARRQTFNHNAFRGPSAFSPQNTEYYQPAKTSIAPLNLPKQYQSNMTQHRENTPPPISVGLNQYSRSLFQQGLMQGLMQSKLNVPSQREKKRMHMSGHEGEGFSSRPPGNTIMRRECKKQALYQSPYHDGLGSMQAHRFDEENGTVVAGNAPQLMPYMYAVNDPRRVSINPPHFSPRATPPYGGGMAGMDPGDVASANETAVFNSYASDMLTCRGESTYHGMVTPMVANPGGLMIQLYFYLDECYEKWRSLEKERKRTEIILTKTFVGKTTAAVANSNQPKSPPNPTRVDTLIVNQMKEHARVASLLDRMQCLSKAAFHANVHTALNRYHAAICNAQARHKEELAGTSRHQRQRTHFPEDRETLLLVIALKDLAATTRKMRTALWCALHMTLPKAAKKPECQVTGEAACSETGASPFEGYSFKVTI
uniref:meiosis-specific coiled-coil domain-containing protein MEIOC n=1 Tax=Gasterosteus aculeatus aculeatus TaxID=481459 RepID=UPI001A98F5D1|nr:meiosis-specific coiled-coil domain-containing protein MEIOC [Gasterosteus aculeatus aculeatus]